MNAEKDDDLRWIKPDSWQNWNFEDVPDHELIACCLWEYARESRTIRMVSDFHWCNLRKMRFENHYTEDPELLKRHNKEARLIEQRLRNDGFDYDDFCDQFWKTDFPLIDIYRSLTELVRDGAEPWQALHPDLRKMLVNEVGKSSTLLPIKLSWLGDLEKLWDSNAADLLKIRKKILPASDDSVEMLLYSESLPIEIDSDEKDKPRELTTMAFTIDFSRFTDAEITVAFQQWLETNRPPRWQLPRQTLVSSLRTGKKLLEYKVSLERLGLMRLLHWHSPKELRENCPEAWKRYGKKEPDFRREIKNASKTFRQLFPFLPVEEQPDSVERHAIWSRRILKAMQEIDAELEREGGNK